MLKTFWRAETAIFLVSWLVLMRLGRDAFLFDPGTLWHPAVGRLILDSRAFIEQDPFSCTRGGAPWIAQQWLAECVMAILDHIGGIDSLLLTLVTVLACLYTWVAHRLLRSGLHAMLVVPLVLLTILASIYHFHPRPHIATLVLLGWTYARLIDFEADRIALRRLFWLVPVFVVWTNLHGGMLGGVATVGLAVAGWGVAWLIGTRSPVANLRQFLVLCLLVVACALAALVNPYGWRLTQVWLYLSGSKVLPQYMIEHYPLHPSQPGDREVVLLAAVYLVALLGVQGRWPRVSWLIPLAWLALAIKSIRHGPLFAITAVLALADLLPHTRWMAWLARHSGYLFRPPQEGDQETTRPRLGAAWFALPTVIFAASLGLQAAAVDVPVVGRGWARLNPDYWPVQLLPELRRYVQEHEKTEPGRAPCIYNDMLFGGFLIRYTPGLRVFLDDRCELYGDDFLLQCFRTDGGDPAMPAGDPAQLRRWLDEYAIDIALVKPGTVSARYFAASRDWRLVGETQNARLYRRQAPMANRDAGGPRGASE
jgi:hypothetical protein